MFIPFHKPWLTGRELEYIAQAHANGRLAGNGPFTKRCNGWLEQTSGCARALLTHSTTAVLEMAALPADIKPGDEVIMPSFTFVSTANAFVLWGGVPVFVGIRSDTLNIDESLIGQAVTPRTRAVVPVHYAGVGCEMEAIESVARDKNLTVIEDAAQALFSEYRGKPLGSFGALAALSFHETKNVISGEGGALLVNDPGSDRAGRDRLGEGHKPRPGGQVHLGRHRLVVPARRDHRRLPLGSAGAARKVRRSDRGPGKRPAAGYRWRQQPADPTAAVGGLGGAHRPGHRRGCECAQSTLNPKGKTNLHQDPGKQNFFSRCNYGRTITSSII